MLVPFKWTKDEKKQEILQRVLGRPGLKEVERKIIFAEPVVCNRLGENTQGRTTLKSRQGH